MSRFGRWVKGLFEKDDDNQRRTSSTKLSRSGTSRPDAEEPPARPTVDAGAKHAMSIASPRGSYQLIARIGAGSFAEVFSGFDAVDTKRTVALKWIRHKGPPVQHVPTATEEETNELVATKARTEILCHRRTTDHPNVITLIDCVFDVDSTALVLDFMPKCLFDLVSASDGLDERKTRRFARQLLQACQYVHSVGVVHRDIKLENLLVSADGKTIMLCDFGLATFWHNSKWLSESCGSIPYAAPEIISGQKYRGPEVDVWSCGVVIAAMRTGRLPFWNDDPQILMRMICTTPPDVDPDFGFMLCSLVQRMLHKDSRVRATIPEALATAYFQDGDV